MWNLLKKELKQYFDQPFAYILLVIFLVLNGFFFFRSVYVSNIASMTPMFDFFPWIFMFLVPALAMRQIAEEKLTGTFDKLLAQPISLHKHLVVKISAPIVFVAIALLLTTIIPLSLLGNGSFDSGQIIAQYVATLLLVASISSLSVLSSSITKNQVIAFVVGVVLTFCFIIVGAPVVIIETQGIVRTVFEQLSIMGHYINMSRGVIDLRDLLYFASFLASTYAITYLIIVRDIVNKRNRNFKELRFIVIGIAILSILINLAAERLPGRIDLTNNKLYTLSPATKKILSAIDRKVAITLYRSQDLPQQVGSSARYVTDLLADIQRKSSGSVELRTESVGNDDESIQNAIMNGIQPVRFNIINNQDVSSSQGVFGLTIAYDGKTERIPFIQDTNNLEYQIISTISKMTNKERPTLYFLNEYGTKNLATNLTKAQKILGARYTIKPLDINDQTKEIPTDASALIIPGITEELPDSATKLLTQYINNGGSVMLLVDGVTIDMGSLTATPNNHIPNKLLNTYGVAVDPSLVLDLRSNDNVTLNDGRISYIMPYPFWPKLLANKDAVGFDKSNGVVMPWASPITKLGTTPENITITPLLSTSQYTGVMKENFEINPQKQTTVNRKSLSPHITAYRISVGNNTSNDGQLIVIGDSDIIDNERILGGISGANALFIENSIDWLAGNSDLSTIRSKSAQMNSLVFSSTSNKAAIRLINMVGVPLAVALSGAGILYRRKQITQRKYNDEY